MIFTNPDVSFVKSLRCVVVVNFGNDCQEMMHAQSQSLIYGVPPEHYKLW